MTQTIAQTPAPSSPPPDKRRRFDFDLRQNPHYVLVPLVFIVVTGLWEFGSTRIGIDEFILPKPSTILEALINQITSSSFWHHTWVTVKESLAGFAIAVTVSMVLGVLISRSILVEKTLMPYVVGFQAIPKVALAPLFVVWFGFGLTSKIVMAAVIAFFPMLINVIEGLKSVDRDKVEMLRTFGASEGQIFRMAQLPSALPFIFAGLDVAAVFSVLGAVVGEFIGAQEGLGYLLLNANYNFNIPVMFAVLLMMSVIGLTAHLIIRALQRRIAFWAEDTRVMTP